VSTTERAARAEHRWPAVVALLVAVVLYALLPSSFLPWLRYTAVAIAALMFIPLIAVNPLRFQRQTKWSRRLSVGQVLFLAAANQVALVQLVYALVHAGKDDGPSLLLAAAQVWITNVIVFALIYWEMDRGGPVTRTQAKRSEIPQADFRFPQDEDHDAVAEWRCARRTNRTGPPATSTTSTSRRRTRWRSAPPTPCLSRTGPRC
jgi:heme/copper-type cytochrome/quinol oxidase subunit 4